MIIFGSHQRVFPVPFSYQVTSTSFFLHTSSFTDVIGYTCQPQDCTKVTGHCHAAKDHCEDGWGCPATSTIITAGDPVLCWHCPLLQWQTYPGVLCLPLAVVETYWLQTPIELGHTHLEAWATEAVESPIC